MKIVFLIVLAVFILTGCSSNPAPLASGSAESSASITAKPEVNESQKTSIPIDSIDEQEFDLIDFIENIIFDTEKEPKMNIANDNTEFYVEANDASPIKDALDIRSWEPVSPDTIPFGEITNSIALHNGNHPASEILIDSQRGYVFVTFYDTDGTPGEDNVCQYPFSVDASVITSIQAVIDDLKSAVE